MFRMSELVDILIRGTGAEKRNGIEWLDTCDDEGERQQLRVLLIHHLRNTHAPPANPDEENMQRRDARAWMLAALGRVSQDDADGQRVLEQHLSPQFERNKWGRYWTLEGIVEGGGDSTVRLASVAKDDGEPLVRCLALAALANGGDSDALQAFRQEFKDNLWASLRALRISMVLDALIFHDVLALVRKGSYSDVTYDAIVALGRVPARTPEAEEAAEVLAGYVRRYRWPMYDSMRTNALISLGHLQSTLSVPVLIEELTDENPMIVLQAGRALRAALGSRTACRRILEAATEGHRLPQVYAGALRALDRAEVVDEIEAALTAGPTREGDAALALLRELGGAEALDRLSAMRRTAEAYVAAQSKADTDLRMSLDRSLAEARQGFRIVAGMDIAVFVAGYSLLAVGVYLLLASGDSLDRIVGAVMSGTGFIGVLLRDWLVKARDRIEPSVRRLVRLQASFHGHLRQLRLVDQAYTQRVLEGRLELGEVRDYAKVVEEATERMVDFLADSDNVKN